MPSGVDQSQDAPPHPASSGKHGTCNGDWSHGTNDIGARDLLLVDRTEPCNGLVMGGALCIYVVQTKPMVTRDTLALNDNTRSVRTAEIDNLSSCAVRNRFMPGAEGKGKPTSMEARSLYSQGSLKTEHCVVPQKPLIDLESKQTSGPGVLPKTGPGVLTKDGPGVLTKTDGPGVLTKTDGPGVLTKDGPGVLTKTDGPGVLTKDGPGVLTKTDGPGVLSKGRPGVLPKDGPGVLTKDRPGVLPKDGPGGLTKDGPGVLSKTDGRGVLTKTDGPGVLSKDRPGVLPKDGPGVLTKTDGPGGLTKDGPGVLTKTDGPGVLTKTDGPGALSKDRPGVLPKDGPGVLTKDVPGVLPKAGPGVLTTDGPGALPKDGPGVLTKDRVVCVDVHCQTENEKSEKGVVKDPLPPGDRFKEKFEELTKEKEALCAKWKDKEERSVQQHKKDLERVQKKVRQEVQDVSVWAVCVCSVYACMCGVCLHVPVNVSAHEGVQCKDNVPGGAAAG